MKYIIKELLEEKQIILQEPSYLVTTNEKQEIQVEYTTCKGDKITTEFITSKKQDLSMAFAKYWEQIGEQYTLDPTLHLIILSPKLYWDIYKRCAYGKEFLKHGGTRAGCVWINGKNYNFPDTKFYFSKTTQTDNSLIRGVYAIKRDNVIIYIGSSSSSVIDRWKEHAQCFKDRDPRNEMYTIEQNLDKISFELLYSDTDINEIFPVKVSFVSAEMIQFVEHLLIKTYQPAFNTEGKTKPFIYRAGLPLQKIDPDYLEIIKDFLENYEYESKEQVKDWFIKKYGNYIYDKFKDLV